MTTDGFFTTCTTCSSRLKVRDQAAIGQIFACPKCGSMVLVAAPEGMEVLPDGESPEQIADAPVDSDAAADWETAAPKTNTNWLAIGAGAFATLAIAGSIFAYYRINATPEIAQIAATESVTTPVEEVVNDAIDEVTDAAPAQPGNTDPEEIPTEVGTDDVPVDEIFSEIDSADANPVAVDGATENVPSVVNPAPAELTPNIAPGTLTNLSRLLSGGATTPIPETTDAPEAAGDAISVPATTLASKSSTAASPSNAAGVSSRLATRVRAVRFEDVSLVHFIRTMMELTGVPIQLDPLAVEQQGTETTVSVAAIDIEVIDVLRQALEPRKLIAVIDRGVVRVTSASTESAANVSTSHFVGDLLGGKGRDSDLPTLISTLIAPESWQAVGGTGSIEQTGDRLTITNTRLATIRTVAFLEKLRAARGLKPRKKLPSHLVSKTPRWQQINRYLKRRISMDVWEPTPVVQIFRDLESAAGLRLLVDWKALAATGIHPSDNATLHGREQIAADVLAHFLDPSNLTLVPINGKTVQVTSKSSATKKWIEIYDLEQLGRDGMSKVEQLMLSGTAALDPAADVAIVLADSATHRDLSN